MQSYHIWYREKRRLVNASDKISKRERDKNRKGENIRNSALFYMHTHTKKNYICYAIRRVHQIRFSKYNFVVHLFIMHLFGLVYFTQQHFDHPFACDTVVVFGCRHRFDVVLLNMQVHCVFSHIQMKQKNEESSMQRYVYSMLNILSLLMLLCCFCMCCWCWCCCCCCCCYWSYEEENQMQTTIKAFYN